jgi:hypothetical protein
MAVLLVTTVFGYTSAFNVVHAPGSVVFTQHECVYCPSTLSGIQYFKLGVKNPVGPTIYVQFTVVGVGSAGDTFSVVSSCITVLSNSVKNNNVLTVPLTSAETGETFTVTYLLAWGTDSTCSSLPNILVASYSFTLI